MGNNMKKFWIEVLKDKQRLKNMFRTLVITTVFIGFAYDANFPIWLILIIGSICPSIYAIHYGLKDIKEFLKK